MTQMNRLALRPIVLKCDVFELIRSISNSYIPLLSKKPLWTHLKNIEAILGVRHMSKIKYNIELMFLRENPF